MKIFEFPEISVVIFAVEDIMTQSNVLPFEPFSVITDEFEIVKFDQQ